MDVENLRRDLKENNQEHLLSYWDSLDEDKKLSFFRDLRSINFAEVKRDFQRTTDEVNDEGKKDEKLEPVPSEYLGSVIGKENKGKVNIWEKKGLAAISEGKVAVLLLAGGQGTRLGVSYPKGMYDVGLPSGKTLYQLQAERILKVQDLAHKQTGKKSTVPWYIMTSEHTLGETKGFFETHNYFGLQRDDVVFFEQHTLPCLTFDGKIILDQLDKVARAPGGNGGLYKALHPDEPVNVIQMKSRGIEYIHVYCVDNILVKMADPVFIGFCIDKSAECGAKVVQKTLPEEKVGVVVKREGKYQVVEYSEISKELTEMKDPLSPDKLLYRAGNICNHFFTLDFLERVVRDCEKSLKFHSAKKKIPFVDENGKRIKPNEPNGIKLEKFVFDVFEFTDKLAVLEVAREEEFSPLKNAKGTEKDSPDTAKRDLCNLHYKYIVEAGGKFINENGLSAVVCEVSPLLSYAGEGLEDVVKGRQFSGIEEVYLKAEDEGKIEEPATKKSKNCL
ncbi:UDP-N-acetylhexosamine pyrophosphorylase-like [Acropora muricata]|uniref:UDP-N-acetylhexosamine pyrophosphorylase-like n=1 Tax=Acropora muricata TaxID=159855 RepID=UPI0034E54195